MFPTPTLQDMRQISDEYHLNTSDEILKFLLENIKLDFESLKSLNEWQNPLHDEKSKYENRECYRPTQRENPYNAWYQKCEIKGDHRDQSRKLLLKKRLAIKDNIFIGMLPMMNGSSTLEGFVPEYDATVIERILSHEGIIVGSTTCQNLCLSGSSYNTTYGPVRNPWNPEYSAGGSSSGSGVVIAAGEADMALGCDQGGSIRIPASSCGIVGLKPTFGLVPFTGIISIVRDVDHVGPMAKTVDDCARLLTAIAGYDDGKDCRQPSNGFKVPNYLTELSSNEPGVLKIGILKEGFEECDERIIKCIQHAISLIKSSHKFQQVTEVSIPEHSQASIPFSTMLIYGTQNQMIDGCGYGTAVTGVLCDTLSEKLHDGLQSQAHTLHDFAKKLILSSAYVKKHGGHTMYSSYAKAQTWLWYIGKAYDEALKEFDVLLMPTLPELPSQILSDDDDESSKSKILKKECAINNNRGVALQGTLNMIRNTAPFNITHHPAITLNAGYDEITNLPIGLQLVGRLWEDATLLKAAKLVEEALIQLQRPNIFMLD